MLFGNFISDSFCLLSRQLKFYSWHYRRDLDQKQRQELLDILDESHFEKLANKIKSLQHSIADPRQQIGKILLENCLQGHRRHQLVRLIESGLVDIDVRLDTYGRTLLHRTAYNLDVELVKLLIYHNVDLKLRDYAGNTALHIAIQSYRNGALIFNNEPDVVQNLTSIIRLLLDADKYHIVQCPSNPDGSSKRIKLHGHQMSGGKDLTVTQNKDADEVESKIATESKDQYNASRRNAITPNEATICRIFGSHNSCKLHCGSKSIKSQPTLDQSTSSSNYNFDNHFRRQKHLSDSPSNHSSTEYFIQSDQCSSNHYLQHSLMESVPGSLVDCKNAFGRTALHYCILVVGEKYLDHFVKLLLSYGADPDAIDIRLKTPLYCLVKRPGVAAVRPKCQAIKYLLEHGCDDLGLAIEPETHFTEKLMVDLDKNVSSRLQQSEQDGQDEAIFLNKKFKRVPSLKHLARLCLIKQSAASNTDIKRQVGFMLPKIAPFTLNHYINRRILDQSELF